MVAGAGLHARGVRGCLLRTCVGWATGRPTAQVTALPSQPFPWCFAALAAPAMTLPLSVPASRRLRRLSALLLLALALVTGVLMTRQSANRLAEVDELILPSVRLVHEMTVVVDEARGLSALHLLHADRAQQRALEDRMQAARLRIERRMAVSRERLADDTERRHFQRVRTSLTAYWAAQDRLLAVSRQAANTPPAAAQARLLLSGDSQAAFHQLRSDLDAWWAYTDERAGLAAVQDASQARQQAQNAGLA